MTISVVVPTYNQAGYLVEAVESIEAQTYPATEIIVVDNASTDSTPEIARGLGNRIRYIRIDVNGGPSLARNTGSTAATGDLIAYLDADDLMEPRCLEQRGGLLAKNPDAGMVVGNLNVVDVEGHLIFRQQVGPEDQNTYPFLDAVRELSCPTCGLFVRKSALETIGFWDETLWIAEDSDLLIRMAAKYRVLLDPEFLANYRQLPSSLSKDRLGVHDAYRIMLAKNEAVAPDLATYRAAAKIGFRNKVINHVFGSILKDREGQKLARIFQILAKRPILAGLFVHWVVRYGKNKLMKVMGQAGKQ